MPTLEKMRARDAMQTDLVQLYPDSSVADAVETFEEYRIGGAPVIDAGGVLVGVLTTTDIVRSGRIHESATEEGLEYGGPQSPIRNLAESEESGFSKEDYSLELLGREVVGDWMTPQVTTVGPDELLLDVCERMARDRIHRVFVTEERRLVGVISTFDIVGLLAAQAQK